ncbi:hypothetical protein G5C65_28015, partial [Streptomyces sp. SB3404]|nr:hypothetical protein [Streptomyces boncukensis]
PRPVRRPGVARPLADAREADYDRYFGIARTPDVPVGTLVEALRSATSEVAAFAPESTEPAVRAGLAVCGLAPPGPSDRVDDSPLGRWRAGHRLFFALIQATVVALRGAAAVGTASHPAPGDTRGAATLLAACAAAMRLTASFSPHAYGHLVRPSMAPPQRDLDGFSGLWSADHRALVGHLRTWGRAHREACSGRCPSLDELSGALAEVHGAHHGICARFVGAQPSLLGTDDDALRTLIRLNTNRSRLLQPPGHTPVEAGTTPRSAP